ncbi:MULTISPECIES: GbsR/MarR family transcriptional regulator [Protofrankia]|uniref:Transcriptional regulator, MarR family n=1 Tax=Candidatus Protofrankia datiscae TaxID=2716812 RepID=F8B5Z6_9ACTN|nr:MULTISPECIES: MarR family transcriptional regulator [Protofrankia]AEH11142.1 transcriptional regulator, MarR family [Candidatus Protofrankia datiscae]
MKAAEGRRPEGDPRAVERFVERFAGALVDAGMPRMPALVFAALLATDDARLTAEELVDQLRISRAAVSAAVRYLTGLGILRRERQPGSRREHYVFEDDSWYEMVARREQVLDRWIVTARAGIDAVGAASPAGTRLAESLAFFEFLQAEMPALLARWRRQQARPS